MSNVTNNPNAPSRPLQQAGSARASKIKGWWEEYKCGCVSEIVVSKKDLLGYCGKHGDNRRQVFPWIES